MKILITDFEYNGKHYDEYELELYQVRAIDDIPEGRLETYIRDSLEDLLG